MEIQRQTLGHFLELRVKGRLDAYWADHLTAELEEVIRAGADRIRLNLAGITYISSLGIRVLLQFYQQLRGIHGQFVVTSPSAQVRKVLEMAGLHELLLSEPADSGPPSEMFRRIDRPVATFGVYSISPGSSLRCAVTGNSELLEGCRFTEKDARQVSFPEPVIAVGAGAFGSNFTESRDRFGEFLAVSGAAAYQPADGGNLPDFLLSKGTIAPEMQVLYSVACEGKFASLARFEAKPEMGYVGLSELAEVGLEISGADTAGVVVVAESAGLVGAALKQSPARNGVEGAPFVHPGIRLWLSFSAERVHRRELVVAVGVVSRSPGARLAALLRPLRAEGNLAGHFHAAAFSYRPLKRGRLELKSTIDSLFEAETLRGVLHLLNDDRETTGAGESEFVRGALWVGPVSEIRSEESK